jgi:hypothetical protein
VLLGSITIRRPKLRMGIRRLPELT